MPTTKALYLDDTYLFASTARIKAISADEQGTFVILDQTIFYPQGGGQPSDIGMIASESAEFQVAKALLRADGAVVHYGHFLRGEFQEGDAVSLMVDKERRLQNARNHTAGHMLTFATEKAYPYLVGMKGYHFPDGPYVEFHGTLSEDEKTRLPEEITQTVQGMIAGELPITVRLVSADELAALCKNILPNTPKDQPTRAMIIDGVALGCGGTHLSNTKEVGSFSIRKVKQEKDKVKISYVVA